MNTEIKKRVAFKLQAKPIQIKKHRNLQQLY